MYVVHQKNGEEADARPAIYAWLKKAAEAGYEEPHDSILKKMVQAVNPNFDQNYKMEETPIEDEGTIDEPQFEDESIAEIDHMRKLAGVMSQTPKAKKKENIHKTTPRSIHKRQK